MLKKDAIRNILHSIRYSVPLDVSDEAVVLKAFRAELPSSRTLLLLFMVLQAVTNISSLHDGHVNRSLHMKAIY